MRTIEHGEIARFARDPELRWVEQVTQTLPEQAVRADQDDLDHLHD